MDIEYAIPEPWEGWYYPIPLPPGGPWVILPYTISFTPEKMCGDRFYNNGNLQSRCACDADSVLQGKSVFWEENGRISSVVYYSKGKMYTKKYYDEGRVTELCNYTYKNGEQLLHGEHIEYSSDGKTTGRYAFGKKTGPYTSYINGKKTSVTTYKDDITIREESFNPDGTLYSLANFDDSGLPIGESYVYTRENDTKYVTRYENGQKINFKRYQSGILVEHEEFNPKLESVLRAHYFPNGDPYSFFKIDSNGATYNKVWREDGTLITDYVVEKSKLVGTGFYTANTTMTRFEQKFNSNGSDYLECFVIVSGDTTEFYYARNEGGSLTNVIVKNKFLQYNGRAVKTGTWTTYENNQLISEINYSQGVRNGKAVYYDTTRSEPMPYLTGNFHKDIRNGQWTLRNDTLLIETNYHLGNLNGIHNVFSRAADTTSLNGATQLPQDNRAITEKLTPIINCQYRNGLMHEKLDTFWDNGQPHIASTFYDGDPIGIWREYNPDGSLHREGVFNQGVPFGKWYVFSKKKNGKIKRKRERGPILVPETTVPMIEDFRPEFLELTAAPSFS